MQHPILNLLILFCFFTKFYICFDLFKNGFWFENQTRQKNADQNKQQILWKKSLFVNSRLGVPSDVKDIYHQYFHFQLNLCHSCILPPNILLKCRKAGCQLATTQWGKIKYERAFLFLSNIINAYVMTISWYLLNVSIFSPSDVIGSNCG